MTKEEIAAEVLLGGKLLVYEEAIDYLIKCNMSGFVGDDASTKHKAVIIDNVTHVLIFSDQTQKRLVAERKRVESEKFEMLNAQYAARLRSSKRDDLTDAMYRGAQWPGVIR